MSTFEDFNLKKQLQYGIDDLGFSTPTPIQKDAFSVILSGKDVVGIAQTGTGKTFAYMLPILQELKFSKQQAPRVLVLVPTRELVLQVVERIEQVAAYINVRVLGVYGGTNINTQKQAVAQGTDIIVATPGRLYDLALSRALSLKSIKKLVIDEVDVMLDLGFRFQLTNIFDILPQRRQNIMFSATMTEDVAVLIDDIFIAPEKISVAVSGTPLDNIAQHTMAVPNFYTKVNVVKDLVKDAAVFSKVLIFVSNKRSADRLFEALEAHFNQELCVIHSNKTQNYRMRSIADFDAGVHRILVATDVMARGLDLDKITHVINFDTPMFAENYMHRIGRTGRAEHQGVSYLLYTPKEEQAKQAIEDLMQYQIPEKSLAPHIQIETRLAPEERPKDLELIQDSKPVERDLDAPGPSFHEKKEKNKKVNLGGSYRREIAKKYKKPKTRGDKTYHAKKRTKKKR